MTAWIALAVAIGFEIAGTSLLKASDGFVRWGIGMGAMACYWVCFGALAFAFKSIPVGVAYAIWSGVGIVTIAGIGWAVFRQPLSMAQIGCIALILIGSVGLNLATVRSDQSTANRTANF
jgi:multidrug transporter EmrE-like cation transporter